MSRSKKGGLIARRKSALQRLEAAYKEFSESIGKDKKTLPLYLVKKLEKHEGNFQKECDRMLSEISVLKSRLHI